MKYNIVVFYKQLTRDRIEFPVPDQFRWVGGGTDLKTGLRDWQIDGETGLGNAVEELTAFCERLVINGWIKGNFKLEVYLSFE